MRLYDRQIDDYIEIIPLPGGGESRGNIDEARLYGIDLSSTINLDPLGERWEGLRLDLDVTYEKSEVIDQLTGVERNFSGLWDTIGDISLRHDIPGTEWAWGLGASYYHAMPSYRLNQVQKNFEGPWYTYGFIEHKDVYGLTVNLEVFNLTDGRDLLDRTVYDGLRTDGVVSFYENRDLSVHPIFRLEITGNF